MKYLDSNELRIRAREVSKMITDLGPPFGPNEAFVAGAEYVQRVIKPYIDELEAELNELRKKVSNNDNVAS